VADPLAVDAELGATLQRVNDLGRQRTVLRRQAQELQTQIALEPDEAKRATLIAQQQETLRAVGITDENLRANQNEARVAQAEQDDRLAVEAQSARLDARQKQREAMANQREASRLDEERFARQREVAQQEINQAKTERIEIIRRGAPELTTRTVLEMAAEELRATNERRPPNFDKVFARLRGDAQEVLRRETAAATEEVTFGVDRAADLARQQDRKRILDAAANEAVIENILADTDQRIAQAATDADRQRLLGRRQAAQDALDAARAESAVVAEERARKAAAQDAKTELTRAQARKAQAEAAKAERRGAGVGRRREQPPSDLFAANEVAFPGTNDIAVTFEDTKDGRKQAEKARQILGFNGQLLDQINQLERIIEDTDAKGVFAAGGFSRSPEWVELESQIDNLVPEVAKIGSGGFAATETDQKWAEGQLPTVPGPWNTKTKALAKVAALRRRFGDRARFALASQTRMRPEVAARLVARARPASISQKDRAEALNDRAAEILIDEQADTELRLQALENVAANARADAKARGDEDDFLALEAATIERSLPGIKNARVREAALGRLAALEGFARDRRLSLEKTITNNPLLVGPAGQKIVDDEARAAQQALDIGKVRAKETFRDSSPESRAVLRVVPGAADVMRELEEEERTERELQEAAEREKAQAEEEKGKRRGKRKR
jgi:hypothetical protein